jgi:hypothetical protein
MSHTTPARTATKISKNSQSSLAEKGRLLFLGLVGVVGHTRFHAPAVNLIFRQTFIVFVG